jgi:hypothetical protein
MIYPEDVKEAARILRLHQPFGSKPWPGDVVFTSNNFTEALRSLVLTNSDSTTSDLDQLLEWKSANPRNVMAIMSRFKNISARQKIYDTVKEIYSLPKQDVVDELGDKFASVKYPYEKLERRKLYFEVAKTTLVPAGKRDTKWIKENGQCLENLRPLKSTIPDAGFGAFAQFGISKGEIVVPAPVLHVVEKETLTLYSTDLPETNNPEAYKLGTSLLVNYCFGDKESSMLLCPMTSAMLLNHCSSRTKNICLDGPNAEVRWSSGWDQPSHEWRDATLEAIGKQKRRLLSLEVVALRDISPGEEGT